MKFFIVLVSMAVFASAQYFPTLPSNLPPSAQYFPPPPPPSSLLCGCIPSQPICASNYKTYNGICAMNCDLGYVNLFKLYDGRCRYYPVGQLGPIQHMPLGAGMRRNIESQLQENHQQNLQQQLQQNLQQNLASLRRNLESGLQQNHQQNLQQQLQQNLEQNLLGLRRNLESELQQNHQQNLHEQQQQHQL